MTVEIRPTHPEDAKALYDMVHDTGITDTLKWDGPTSYEDYAAAVARRVPLNAEGVKHCFTILYDGAIAGDMDIRPYDNGYAADIGLWIGKNFHRKGIATEAIRQITRYGFEKLKLEKIEAAAFVGNEGSRRAFEKNGYRLEGIIRMKIKKRGRLVDEYVLGITRSDYDAQQKSPS